MKNALYGIVTGFLYAFVYSMTINLYLNATVKKIALFTIIGLVSGLIYSFLTNLFRKMMGHVLLRSKVLLCHVVSNLISVSSCGILFYFFNLFVLSSSSSSPERFMVSIQKATFEIIVNFTLITLIINVTRALLETRQRGPR